VAKRDEASKRQLKTSGWLNARGWSVFFRLVAFASLAIPFYIANILTTEPQQLNSPAGTALTMALAAGAFISLTTFCIEGITDKSTTKAHWTIAVVYFVLVIVATSFHTSSITRASQEQEPTVAESYQKGRGYCNGPGAQPNNCDGPGARSNNTSRQVNKEVPNSHAQFLLGIIASVILLDQGLISWVDGRIKTSADINHPPENKEAIES
jgi:Na+/melibiose symporter-like transporter